MITDVTVCDGGNHLTFYVNHSEWNTYDIEDIQPDKTHHWIAEFMREQKEEDVERLYNIIIAIRMAQATTYEQIKQTTLGLNV